MRRTSAVLVLVSLVLAACSGADDNDDDEQQPPTLDGINGPAVVDPSYDPFATEPSTPPTTDAG